MRPLLLTVLLLGCSAPLAAQTADAAPPDPLQAAQARLQKAVAKTAALPACAFEMEWGAPKDARNGAGGNAMLVVIGGASEAGKAEGGWADGELLARFPDQQDELRLVGRRMLARQQNGPWALRRGTFADGNAVPFLPDPQQFLQTLAGMPLAAAHREVGSLYDRPVEIVGVTLSQEQAESLLHSGLLPRGIASEGLQGVMLRQIQIGAQGAAAARSAPKLPELTLDLAFYLEPGTGLLHRIAARSHAKQAAQFGGMVVVNINGQQAGGGDDDEENEDEPAKDKAKAAPSDGKLDYQAGLPVRPRKKTSVFEFAIDLHDHGAAKLPALDEAQQALLGR